MSKDVTGHELFSNVPNFLSFFFLEGGDPVPILIGGCQIEYQGGLDGNFDSIPQEEELVSTCTFKHFNWRDLAK